MRSLPKAWLLRLRFAGAVAALGIAVRACTPSPPARTVEGVAAMLGDAVHGVVKPGELVWEREDGVVSEALFGRGILFLAAEHEGAPRDLYRARVRVSIEGAPIAVTSVYDLTSSPLGDELGITADGPYAKRYVAFASSAYGSISDVTLLDLDGDGELVGNTSWLERFLGQLTNLSETGTSRGLGKVVFSLETPLPTVRLGFDKGALVIASSGDGPASAYDLASGQLRAANDTFVTAQHIPHLRKPAILWAVDTVRGVVGAGPIAALEDAVFGARDKLRQAEYKFSGKTEVAKNKDEDAPTPSPPLDASAAGDDGGYWPPSKLASLWQDAEAGEGVWEPATYSFQKRLPGGSDKTPAYFYKTWIKPDSKRPYAKVLIVAMDMRQLDIGMEGGVEDPKPLTGTKSFGRIPREPQILNRVVGAFNGAFKTTHGAYGMMVDKRVLLPPKPGAATVVITEDRHVGMGTWPESDAIPDTIASFRQNLDALVEGGRFNPTGRLQWGFQLPGTAVTTERSGICVTKPGHFLYLWGDDISAPTLGKAMVQAGCQYGMHLDMNPKHTGFVFADIRDVHKKDYDAKLLTNQMEILPERYIEWSPKDFFYVMLRDTTEPPVEGGAQVAWKTDTGTQPAPAWLPAVHEAVVESQGVEVRVLGIDAGRTIFRVTPGRQDGDAKAIDDADAKKVIAALGLGNGKRPRPLGLSLDGKERSSFRSRMGYLVIDANGALTVTSGDTPSTDKMQAVVELPLIVSNGNLTLAVEATGAARHRGAACVLPSGRIAFAFSNAPSDAANAGALAKMGCKTAVALDRGSHEEGWLERAGKQTSGVAREEQTAIYAIGVPMKPRAFEWKP